MELSIYKFKSAAAETGNQGLEKGRAGKIEGE